MTSAERGYRVVCRDNLDSLVVLEEKVRVVGKIEKFASLLGGNRIQISLISSSSASNSHDEDEDACSIWIDLMLVNWKCINLKVGMFVEVFGEISRIERVLQRGWGEIKAKIIRPFEALDFDPSIHLLLTKLKREAKLIQ